MDTRLHVPFTILLAGSSSAGKTTWTRRFLSNIDEMTDKPINRIVWCYTEEQDFHDTVDDPRISFHMGLPKAEDLSADRDSKLIILDDLMSEVDNSITNLFTRQSHHRDISVVFITQNLFHKGKGMRDISLNSTYFVLFKCPRDRSQVSYFARQVQPRNVKFFCEAFEDATSAPYGYLLVDCHQKTPDNLRFRTSIFPDDHNQYAYTPK